MTHRNDRSDRIDELEIRITHQDRIIEDLNQIVTEQWKQIDKLLRRVERLTERVESAETRLTSGQAPEPPPPHY
jgi:SlyX protein